VFELGVPMENRKTNRETDGQNWYCSCAVNFAKHITSEITKFALL